MKKFIALSACLIFSLASFGQTYPVSDIPDHLLANADAVVRSYNTVVTVENANVIYKNTYVITVLNERGNQFGDISLVYNSFTTVEKMQGQLFDASGKKLKTMRKDGIVDMSTFGSSFSFHADTRVKHFDFGHRQYPYTVKYEYETNSINNFFIPDWCPQFAPRISVEKASLKLGFAPQDSIKMKSFRIDAPKLQSEWKSKAVNYYNCELSNLKPYFFEPNTVNFYQSPTVCFTALKLVLDTFAGTTDSWQQIGKFIGNINEGRDELPHSVKQKAQDLVKDAKSDREKIQILYKYLQSNTRYVANEYGIAGWQTFLASDVAKTGYGDCKGLSNYLKALLKSVGISSNLVLINAGSSNYNKVDPSFVDNKFNHMILCVPLHNDTMWLECTSNILPAGYLGDFTHNRYALVLDNDGGKLVRTPKYDKSVSFIKRNINVDFSKNEEVNITWNTIYSGMQQDPILPEIINGNQKKWNKQIERQVAIADVNFENVRYSTKTSEAGFPIIEEEVRFATAHMLESTEKRLYCRLPQNINPFENFSSYASRNTDFYLEKDFMIDLVYQVPVPAGYRLEAMPAEEMVQKEFGTFSRKSALHDGVLTVNCQIKQNQGDYGKDQFGRYKEFVNQVKHHLQATQLIFIKQ
jgi:hypothetical protein